MWDIILNFDQAMLVSVIQMRLMNKVLRKQKIMVNNRDNIILSSLELYIHRLKKYISSGPFDQIFCGMDRISNEFISFFPKENVFLIH